MINEKLDPPGRNDCRDAIGGYNSSRSYSDTNIEPSSRATRSSVSFAETVDVREYERILYMDDVERPYLAIGWKYSQPTEMVVTQASPSSPSSPFFFWPSPALPSSPRPLSPLTSSHKMAILSDYGFDREELERYEQTLKWNIEQKLQKLGFNDINQFNFNHSSTAQSREMLEKEMGLLSFEDYCYELLTCRLVGEDTTITTTTIWNNNNREPPPAEEVIVPEPTTTSRDDFLGTPHEKSTKQEESNDVWSMNEDEDNASLWQGEEITLLDNDIVVHSILSEEEKRQLACLLENEERIPIEDESTFDNDQLVQGDTSQGSPNLWVRISRKKLAENVGKLFERASSLKCYANKKREDDEDDLSPFKNRLTRSKPSFKKATERITDQ